MNVRLSVLAVVVLSVGCGLHKPQLTTAKATPDRGGATRGTSTLSLTLESSDRALQSALLELAVAPTAEAHRHVANEYRRLGVLDAAHEHFTSAVEMDRSDAASYDALARIWRDWGVPKMALEDARRAVASAPRSATAANTLGTVFQALGEFSEAKRWYARALGLDSTAWYALNNLCYAEIMTRESYALATCRKAVDAAPDAIIARNNLALAHAAAGDFGEAMRWFRRAADTATANYNYGIVMMSANSFREAEVAFHSALLADPGFTMAASRARQARLAALAEEQLRVNH